MHGHSYAQAFAQLFQANLEVLRAMAPKQHRSRSRSCSKGQAASKEDRVCSRARCKAQAASQSSGTFEISGASQSSGSMTSEKKCERDFNNSAFMCSMNNPWIKVAHPSLRGVYYYFNEDTEESLWEPPPGCRPRD